ncbi:MAG: zinc-ribbon domain-containing protein [Thermoplasmata archaeon]
MGYSSGQSYPNAAFILTLIGGIFVILAGLVYAAIAWFLASISSSVGFGIGGYGAGIAIAFALVALIIGFLLIYGAIQLRNHPEGAKTWGIIIIVLALVSWVGGGGFYIGLILALIGGILALVWRAPAPMMGQPGQAAWGQPPPMAPAPGGTPMSAPGQKFCSSCGSPNAAGVQFCAKCGAAMPP